MNKRIVLVAIVILCVTSGFLLGFSGIIPVSKYVVPDAVKKAAEKVKVEVVNTGETFTFDIDDPLCKILFYQGGGVSLATAARAECEWQICLGQEDNPYDGKGDSIDVILKFAKFKDDAKVYYSVGCLGSYNKKVYYLTELKLDTTTGSRFAEWNA
jgi:hypothetical protein